MSTAALGRLLRQTREAAGLTQDQLAHATGYSQGAISLWELGARVPNALALSILAGTLEVSIAALADALAADNDDELEGDPC